MEGYLGIDVSKGYSDFVLINKQLNVLEKTIQLDDTTQGHGHLKQWLAQCVITHGLTQVYAGLESSGGFENNWYAMLIDAGRDLPIKVCRLNPLVVSKSGQASSTRPVTDAISAEHIAGYLVRYADQVSYQQADTTYRSFRSFHNHIELLTRQKSQLINEVKQLLYSCLPELQRYCKKSIPRWVLELLIKYPSAARLSRAKAQTVAKIRGITKDKAQRLIQQASQSIASRGDALDEYTVANMARDILNKKQRVDQYKAALVQRCQGPEVEVLQSIKGIGAYSAACIMIQIEDIARFSSPKRLAAYFGLHPTIKQSGDKQAVSRMSKQGRAQIRKTLFMCANSAVLHDPHMKAIYHRHRAKGKKHKQALGVIMHKMLRIVWGVLTSQKPYDAQIDKTNQQKQTITAEQNMDLQTAFKRRLQDFDENAPISRIATKKRKAYQLSQVSKAEQVRDLVDTLVNQT
jgi:transposase